MALGHREDHGVFYRPGVELRRAHKVAHVLQDYQVQIRRAQLTEALLRHARVQVAHAAGVELDAPHTDLRNGRRVHVRVDVRLHDADAQVLLQRLDGAQQGGGLPGPGGGHEVQKKGLLRLQPGADAVRLPVVIGKNALLDLDDFIFFHGRPPAPL